MKILGIKEQRLGKEYIYKQILSENEGLLMITNEILETPKGKSKRESMGIPSFNSQSSSHFVSQQWADDFLLSASI